MVFRQEYLQKALILLFFIAKPAKDPVFIFFNPQIIQTF